MSPCVVHPTVDLFAGAGGMTLGFGTAGFDVVAAGEWDEDACDTFATHHPKTELVRGDLALDENLSRFAEHVGSARVVIGGPPCPPWAAGGLRRGDDPRDGLPTFVKLVRLLQPDAFVMENVAGVLRNARRTYFDSVVAELAGLGYVVRAEEVRAQDFGVPQDRRCAFTIGLRGKQFEFPEPSHGCGRAMPWASSGECLSPQNSVGEPNPFPVRFAKRVKLRASPYDDDAYIGAGRPVDLRQPAPAMLPAMCGDKTHWLDPDDVVPEYHEHLSAGGAPRAGIVPGARRVTVAEAALIQTFPVRELHGDAGIVFAGSRASQYRQVGGAVPPRLSQVLAEALAAQID